MKATTTQKIANLFPERTNTISGSGIIKNNYNHDVRLKDTFPSADLLNSLNFIDGDDVLLKEAVDFLSYAVRVLVRHNWDTSDSFEWLRMFEVAAFIDPKYSFLDSVR